MPELADVFACYGGAYLDKYGDAMLPSHRRALQDILHCRTEAMGGHAFQCDACGQIHYSYHSCGNCSCPKCHHTQTEDWLAQRCQELLPTDYFHVIFTIPAELRGYVRSHQTKLCGMLMKAAAQSLIKLAADPHYVGGLVGILAVLHTWGGALSYHPHVHCLVPAGGLNRDSGEWLSSKKDFLVPVKALSKIFRGLFRHLVRKTCPDLAIPASVWNCPWVIHCKPAGGGTETVLNYLGRYVYRVAITNSRIISVDHGPVAFRYKDSGHGQWKTMSLPGEEFIRRFLQHVLPRGFHKVRYYGLWAPGNRGLLRHVQLQLTLKDDRPPAQDSEPDVGQEASPSEHPLSGRKCPHCGKGVLVWLHRIPRLGRAPP